MLLMHQLLCLYDADDVISITLGFDDVFYDANRKLNLEKESLILSLYTQAYSC